MLQILNTTTCELTITTKLKTKFFIVEFRLSQEWDTNKNKGGQW